MKRGTTVAGRPRATSPRAGNHCYDTRELALAGGGIILQPAFIVGRDLIRGTLAALLPDWKTLELSLYFVYLSQRQLSPKVRAFIDLVIESIGKEPYSEH